jgi:hypothetical protein
MTAEISAGQSYDHFSPSSPQGASTEKLLRVVKQSTRYISVEIALEML